MVIPTYKSGILQVKAYRILQMKVSHALKKFHINPSEWSILGITFESSNGIRLTEVAKILHVETALITILVNGLVQKKLIERYEHPKDRRAKLLFLTQEGKQLVPHVEKELKTVLYELLAGIPKEDLDTYKRVLETIVANDTQ